MKTTWQDHRPVIDFVKNWRRKNPRNEMAPMIGICNGHLYEQLDLASLSETDMIILCDTQPDARPGSNGVVSRLGDGSEAYPFHVGMTCLQQIRAYIAVQKRNDCTSMFHLDSTHSMVIHGYSVFAFGYSGQSCHFYPLAFFCTSQKRKLDVAWCIGYIKRVCMETCGVCFDPGFVMMDGDIAQFNACVTELPHSAVLMCWFHVTKNVWAKAAEFKVSSEDSCAVFEDLYDMHYAARESFPTIKEGVLARWRSQAEGSAVRRLTDHIIKQWVETSRFSKWQAFYTPMGYAGTNNPLEQYHRRLKLEVPMVHRLLTS